MYSPAPQYDVEPDVSSPTTPSHSHEDGSQIRSMSSSPVPVALLQPPDGTPPTKGLREHKSARCNIESDLTSLLTSLLLHDSPISSLCPSPLTVTQPLDETRTAEQPGENELRGI